MEETQRKERQESEYKDPNEDQGGIRRRLRDRDLLRKRKAEAEERETNQVENQRKRPRVNEKNGKKKRGRPRKTDVMTEMPVIQEESTFTQEAPAVTVVPESMEPKLESPPEPVLSTPLFESAQSSAQAPVLAAPSPVNQTSAFASSPLPAPPLANVFDMTPDPVQVQPPSVAPAPAVSQDPTSAADLAPDPAPDPAPLSVSTPLPYPDAAPAPAPAPTLDPEPAPPVSVPSPPDAAPPQVGTLYTEVQGSEGLNQVLIEDLGPDEDEDLPPQQEMPSDEDLNETSSINIPKQNTIFSIPTFSSPPPPQEYLPGNSF